MDVARRLVAVGRKGKEEDEEDQAGGGDEPQLHHRVGTDEKDHLVRVMVRVRVSPNPNPSPSPSPNPNPNQEGHRGEQELAREVDGLPVVVLVLVGVREQRDARALHPFGRGVLARRLAHLVGKGLGVELGLELE